MLRVALPCAVRPGVVILRIARGLRHHRSVVALLAEWPGDSLAHEVDLTRADEDVSSNATAEELDGRARVGAGVCRSVEDEIEIAIVNGTAHRGRIAAVGTEAVDSRRQLVRRHPAVQ